MKMMKAMRKLRFWSKKKRKKTSKFLHEVEPHYNYHCSLGAAVPSAPPLPPWLDWEAQASASFPAHAYESVPETCPAAPTAPPPNVYQEHLVPDFRPGLSHGTGVSQAPASFPAHAYESVPETCPAAPTVPPPYVNQEYLVPDYSAGLSHGTGVSASLSDPVPVPVPVPVLVPVMAAAVERERSAGFFGCVFNLGVHALRCFFPCFSIREETFPLLPARSHS